MAKTSSPRVRAFKTIVRVVVLAIPVVLLYQVFIPPIGGLAAPQVPTLVELPAAENSEPLYVEAVRDSIREVAGAPVPRAIADPDVWAANGYLFSPDDLAYLQRFQPSAQALLAGSRRPAFQYFTSYPGISTDNFAFAPLRQTNHRLVARAMGLAQQAKSDQAVDLVLASYACGSAWASDAACPLAQGLCGMGIRKNAATALFHLLYKATLSRAALIKIATAVARQDSLDLSPARYQGVERQALDRYLYSAAVGKPEPGSDPSSLPRAFRERSMLEFRLLEQRFASLCLDSFTRYDLPRMLATERTWHQTEDYRMTLGFLFHHPRPALVAACAMFSASSPNWTRALALCSVDRATARGLEAIACLKAYKLAHGSYPSALAPAFTEAGVKLATDVNSGLPMGYRLGPDGQAVAWLSGVDCKDDGGKREYTRKNQVDPSVVGCDLIYSTADLPVAFRAPYAGP